jgi:hypothetical protein
MILMNIVLLSSLVDSAFEVHTFLSTLLYEVHQIGHQAEIVNILFSFAQFILSRSLSIVTFFLAYFGNIDILLNVSWVLNAWVNRDI